MPKYSKKSYLLYFDKRSSLIFQEVNVSPESLRYMWYPELEIYGLERFGRQRVLKEMSGVRIRKNKTIHYELGWVWNNFIILCLGSIRGGECDYLECYAHTTFPVGFNQPLRRRRRRRALAAWKENAIGYGKGEREGPLRLPRAVRRREAWIMWWLRMRTSDSLLLLFFSAKVGGAPHSFSHIYTQGIFPHPPLPQTLWKRGEYTHMLLSLPPSHWGHAKAIRPP